jgi:hypothetical protein
MGIMYGACSDRLKPCSQNYCAAITPEGEYRTLFYINRFIKHYIDLVGMSISA